MTALLDIQREALPFDGLIDVCSTCRDCGEIMRVTDIRQTAHPGCDPKLTKIEVYEQRWYNIAASVPYEAMRPEIRKYMDDLEFKIDALTYDGVECGLANAAMQYAEWGWKVFPLGERSKKPGLRNAHPQGDPLRGKCKGECGKLGHGVLDATSDMEQICRWWSAHPYYNIGLATGFGFDVVDVDPGHGGHLEFAKALLECKSNGCLLEPDSHRPPNHRFVSTIPIAHAVVATAGSDAIKNSPARPGGLHLYVKATGRGNFANVRPGIDYRGLGGYVVAPPSTLGTRVRTWTFAVEPSPIIKRGNNNAKT
jgi:hypothetical protein